MVQPIHMFIRTDPFSVEASGTLLEKGWLPGTWMKALDGKPQYSRAVCKAEFNDGLSRPIGFAIYGSSKLANTFDFRYPADPRVNEWTIDVTLEHSWEQPEKIITLDEKDKTVSQLGSGVFAVQPPSEGVYKIYTFERYDREYRDNDGVSGGLNTYSAGDLLYISSRGLFTSEQETTGGNPHYATGVAVMRYSTEGDDDNFGPYIIATFKE